MLAYRVIWTVDVNADSFVDAVNHARLIQLEKYPIQPVFKVQEIVRESPIFSAVTLDVTETKDQIGAHLPESPVTLPSGLRVTADQYRALMRVYTRGESPMPFGDFLRTVQGAVVLDCIMLPWAGMWLGIETDGYTHS